MTPGNLWRRMELKGSLLLAIGYSERNPNEIVFEMVLAREAEGGLWGEREKGWQLWVK
jgi:hypothetical protein